METTSMTSTAAPQDRVRRYVIVHEQSNRIVATLSGTHSLLERICDRLDGRRPGTYFYDELESRGLYQPQVGPNVAVSA